MTQKKLIKAQTASQKKVATFLTSSNTPLKRILYLKGIFSDIALPPFYQKDPWKVLSIDNNRPTNADLTCAFTHLKDIPDNSFHAVWAPYTLMRLPQDRAIEMLKECYRVLGANGMLMLRVFDLQTLAEVILKGRWDTVVAKTPQGEFTAQEIVYGCAVKDQEFIPHMSGYLARPLGKLLIAAGFDNIKVRREGIDIDSVATKNLQRNPEKPHIEIIEPDINKIMMSRDELEKKTELPVPNVMEGR